MTNQKPAHREFWIAAPERYWHVDSGSLVCYKNAAELKDFEGDTIHVVEFKAFEALQNELDHCMKNYQDLGLHISKDKNLERLQKENEALEKEIAELRKQLKWKQESLNYSTICIKSNHEKYEALETENAQLKSELADSRKNTAEFAKNELGWIERCEKAEAENAQLKAEVKKAKSHELTTAVFAVDEKLREELAAAKSEIERLTQLDYSKEDARRNDKLGKLKIDMLEAQGYIETQDLQINALSRELQEYEHETETIKEMKVELAKAKELQKSLLIASENSDRAAHKDRVAWAEEKIRADAALAERDELLKERAAYRTLNSLMADNAEVCELHDDIEALEAKLAEKDAQREKHNQELADAYKIFQADLDAALAKAQAMEQALEFYADLNNYNTVEGSISDMQPRGLEQKLWKVLDMGEKARETLAKWRGK